MQEQEQFVSEFATDLRNAFDEMGSLARAACVTESIIKDDAALFLIAGAGEEPWATRRQMADLFGRSVQRIGIHVNNILEEGELPPESNVRKAYIAGSAKPVETYSLDMVLAVGYRVDSARCGMTPLTPLVTAVTAVAPPQARI